MKIYTLIREINGIKAGQTIAIDGNGIGIIGPKWDEWEIPEFIMKRNPAWFREEVKYMDKDEKNVAIRKEFIKLKEAHDWCNKKEWTLEDGRFLSDKVLPEVEKIYGRLENLGVSRSFSVALFIFGAELTEELMEQF